MIGKQAQNDGRRLGQVLAIVREYGRLMLASSECFWISMVGRRRVTDTRPQTRVRTHLGKRGQLRPLWAPEIVHGDVILESKLFEDPEDTCATRRAQVMQRDGHGGECDTRRSGLDRAQLPAPPRRDAGMPVAECR